MDNKYIDVATGEIAVSSQAVVLRIMAIGSCVVVTAYGRRKKIGGLAHIMLPGRALRIHGTDRTKYAEDAIDILLNDMKTAGAGVEDLEINLLGGADIIGQGSISKEIVDSVLNYLKKIGIEPEDKRIGGTKRRSVSLYVDSGKVFYTEGDSDIKEL